MTHDLTTGGTAVANPLITPEELHAWSGRPPVVLDVRWRLGGPSCRGDYLEGHLPGAVFVDLDADLCGPPGVAGRHPLPSPQRLQTALRAAGIRDRDPVVVYDGGDHMAAARAWWTLRWAGLSDVRVLDGGLPAWQGARLPVTPQVPSVEQGDVVVREGSVAVLDAVAAATLATAGRLVDVRAPERYRGENEPVDPVAGHIPGALNLFDAEVGDGGRFAAPAALKERYTRAGLTSNQPVGAYCGSGVTAARTVLGMTIAGFDPVLYVGSWSEWITDPSRPVAQGSQS